MMNECWILSDDFFPFICWSDLVIIFLRLLLLWCMIADFQMLHIWNASYLDVVCNSFYGLLGFFSYIWLGILLLCSWEVFVLNFFLWISSSDFDIRVQYSPHRKGIRRCSFCFYFLGEIVENCYHFFLKFLLEFISGNIWVCYCLYWKLIIYRLNFFNRYRPIQSIYFDLWQWC